MGKGTDKKIEQALSQLLPAVRARFAEDPIGAITSLGIDVSEAPKMQMSRDDGGHCDGVSFLEHDVILYTRTKSKRENFTLAHELGHWLINRTEGIYDWVGDQPNPMAIIENLCDRIAQSLLLPEALINQVVGDEPLRAEHLLELHRQSNASRAASSVALVRRLPGAGAIAYASRDTGAIEHASIQPHPEHGWPTVFPWPGQSVPQGPFLELGAGQRVTRLSAWYTPWRNTADFYIDAIADDFYVYLVFSETNLWNITTGFAAQPLEYDKRPTQKFFCCGQQRVARGYPCGTCGRIPCPNCNECLCDKRAAKTSNCRQCNSVVMPHLLNEKGLCELCA